MVVTSILTMLRTKKVLKQLKKGGLKFTVEEGGAGDFGTTKLRKKYEEDTPKSVNEAVADITVDPRNKISKSVDQNKHGMNIAKQAKEFWS